MQIFEKIRVVTISTLFLSSILIPSVALAEGKDVKQDKRNKSPQQQYTLEQAMSDKAQLNTIAFNGLAFLTGDFGASTFIPPGKVADFFGFQYMRDIDVAMKGHNPMFLDRVAGNVIHTLNDEQKSLFLALAKEQAPELEALARMRLPLVQAFHLTAEKKTDRPELDKQAVMTAVGDIFEKDAQISYRRAEIMAQVALSLTQEQKEYFSAMKFGDFNSWPALTDDMKKNLKVETRGLSKMVSVAYMTYASEFFSWVSGNIDADVYFCPERHGTYFGGFYMKDMPAMGQSDYDIPLDITGNSGEAFIQLLDSDQQEIMASIMKNQEGLLKEVAQVRRDISEQLRMFLLAKQPDLAAVAKLGRQYGELDGEMSYYYATAFAEVNQTLSEAQRETLIELRNLDDYTSAPYYLYSRAMKDELVELNTASLFLK